MELLSFCAERFFRPLTLDHTPHSAHHEGELPDIRPIVTGLLVADPCHDDDLSPSNTGTFICLVMATCPSGVPFSRQSASFCFIPGGYSGETP